MSDATPPVASAPPPPVETRPPPSRKKIPLALGIALVSVLVVAGLAWFAYQKIKANNQPPASMAPRVSEKKAAPSTPLPAVAQKEATPAPAPKTIAPAVPPHTPARVTAAEPATGAAEATANAEPNPAAQDWINKLKISGVRGGASPKILLQGKTFGIGDVIHADLGLAFAGYDPDRDVVRFKDGAGAIYQRGVR
jgi:hypothetical protein